MFRVQPEASQGLDADAKGEAVDAAGLILAYSVSIDNIAVIGAFVSFFSARLELRCI